VIAIDGPQTWQELRRGEAIRLVEPDAHELAGAIAAMLGDESAQESLGARGRAFAAEQMGVGRTARAAVTLIEQSLGSGAPSQA
jgi:hypothetical protein